MEIGFPFPCAEGYISSVTVNQNSIFFGSSSLTILNKGFLPDVPGLLSHIYVARTSDSFTVRYGTFASVTLYADGRIRLAFGSDADTFSVVDPQVPLCTLYGPGATMSLSSAEGYAGSNDFILTPNGPFGLSFNCATLSGRPFKAGDHAFRVKVTAQDSAENTYTMTRTFNLAVTEAAQTKPAITVSSAPDVGSDGFVHLNLGETANFAATVADGEQIRWTFDDAVATSVGTVSYTLNVPEERTLNATGAKIHRVAVEADDAAGRYGWSVRKVWHVIYNRKVYIDTTSTASTGSSDDSSSSSSADGTDETGRAPDSGAQTADGLSLKTAYTDFPAGMFKYLMSGDEVIVKPGTYTTPIDFEDNAAEVMIRATEGASNTVVDVAGAGRCFRQGTFEITTGKSGGLEKIFLPARSAANSGTASSETARRRITAAARTGLR